ncbi:MAG: acetate--CoA ligase family protein [bacterium]|nr:acetate--CoA ligase family protein [bacterium]
MPGTCPHRDLMDRFFRPRSVAIIGLSRTTGEGSFNILENLLNYGYPGQVYPVNPHAAEILGVPCYPCVDELPVTPDLAIITLPRHLVPGVVGDCARKGIKAVILVTQGFAETDAEGIRLQEEFLAALASSGTRLLGPNTLGTVNAFDGFSSSFTPMRRADPLPTGMICQTGFFLAVNLAPSVGLGLGVDVGNAVDLGVVEFLDYLGGDDRVEVIALHLEGLGDGRRFCEVASEVTRHKPVLALKTGRSAAGAAAAGSHTGSLAGEDAVYDAAFRQAGVLRLSGVDELDDVVKAFLHLPPLRGNRLAIVTATGGGGIMAVDACAGHGIEVARLSGDTLAALKAIGPPWFEPGNPMDVWPAAIGKPYPLVFAEIFTRILNDPNVDAVLCIGGAVVSTGTDLADFIEAAAALQRDKPVVWWVQGQDAPRIAARVEKSRKVAVYPSPDRAVRALALLHRYYSAIRGRRPEPPATLEGIDALKARELLRREAGYLGPAVFDLLAAYGIAVAPWAATASPAEAGRLAGVIGYPVAVKGYGAGLVHKTERGAVILGLTTRREVERAAADLLGRTPAEGLLVQKYFAGGHEVILGGKQDPQFGPVVLYGAGGVHTEILADVSLGLAPLSVAEGRRLLEETRFSRILAGTRGQSPGDQGALLDTLLRLSRLIADHPPIAEIDLNPVLVFSQGCVTVDARVRRGEEE